LKGTVGKEKESLDKLNELRVQRNEMVNLVTYSTAQRVDGKIDKLLGKFDRFIQTNQVGGSIVGKLEDSAIIPRNFDSKRG